MRIDAIMVITGLDDEALRKRQQALKSFASPGTDIRLVVTPDAPSSVESQAEMELAAPGILQRVVESERDSADGVVIWGGHDPSLEAAREMVSIPVFAPGMASMYLASMLADSFSLLVQLDNVLSIAKQQVLKLGLDRRCVSVRSVNVPVLELTKPESYPAMLRAAVAAVDQDGTDAICFGCMAMTPHAERLAGDLDDLRPGVVVINPGFAAVRLTEMMIGMGLTHSSRSYPRPPKPINLWFLV